MKKINVFYEIEIPTVPNFLRVANSEAMVAISAVKESALRESGRCVK